MRSSVFLASLLLSSACTATPREGPLPTDADIQTIANDALDTFVNSWNRAAQGDSAAYLRYGSLYWPDAELVDPSGRVWDGQPSIVQMHTDLWKTAFKDSHVVGAVRRVRVIAPSVVIVDFDFTLTLAGPPPPGASPSGPLKAHLKHIMEKRGNDWKVVAAQNTFDSGAGPSR
jgi:uncharacterized protein (TIGR02246 family)